MSHDDTVRKLGKKFETKCYENFGSMLLSMTIHGFRGVKDLTLSFESPITAIAGLNGTGKSTIVQLATCAFPQPDDHPYYRFYVKHFFPVSVVDPEPFSSDAQVGYAYAVEGAATPQHLTVSRKAKEWSGYKRQPPRATYYIGFTQFLPKVERRDFSIYGARHLELGEARQLVPETAQMVGRILGLPYEQLGFTNVQTGNRSSELAMATRAGRQYSENHMGFGEGRVVYMVNTLEAAPPKSLIVLEEPETSLHGDAQIRLARYLVDVANRRGHQIILTTHSASILGQLGRKSVVCLRRNPAGEVSATHGLSTYQIDSYLQSENRPTTGVTICVEDVFACCLTTEILRRSEPDLLAGCSFLKIGGGQEIPAAVKLLKSAGLRAVGLSDGDMPHDGTGGVMTLPGTRPPEKEVFEHPAVKTYFAGSAFSLDLGEVLAGVANHHDYAAKIAARLRMEEAAVVHEACRAYSAGHEASDFELILDFLRKNLSDRR
ncbi:AAA family ATPase [Streptomyces decoyicus]|uniref:ATP-dependent nuclease n=1 Tax=Streptomyces decoyicus TaxID=249567 RepID=UPI002E31B296|nr:AAA family ATPase [Streptomyces decoyicus]